MKFPLFEDVILLVAIPEAGLLAGDVGTVVERHDVPDMEVGYSVEFFDMVGNTLTVITLPGSKLRLPRASDRPTVRQLSDLVDYELA